MEKLLFFFFNRLGFFSCPFMSIGVTLETWNQKKKNTTKTTHMKRFFEWLYFSNEYVLLLI